MIRLLPVRMRLLAVAAGMLMLASCGYHLVGHGGGTGAIPADVHTLTLSGNGDATVMSALRQRLLSDQYQLVEDMAVADQAHHALLHVHIAPLVFVPSAYDATGIATQFHMSFNGSLMIEQDGKTVWQTGAISRDGDLFVAGGPASIDASRLRLLRDLQKQWVSDAIGRIRSGF